MFVFSIYIKNKNTLLKFANVLSKLYFSGFIITSAGKVGIGKTKFIKGFIGEYINYKYNIKSPTYSLVETYSLLNIFFHHFDLYRLSIFQELHSIDLNTYLTNHSILFFEWGNKFITNLFFAHIYIYFFFYSNSLNRFILLKSSFVKFKIILKY